MLKRMAPTKKRISESSSKSETPKNKKAAASNAEFVMYEKDEKLLSKYGDNWYEAKILDITDFKGEKGYLIHYQGWNKRHDEFVTVENSQQRFQKFNAAEADKAKKKEKESREELKTPKAKFTPSKAGSAKKEGSVTESTPKFDEKLKRESTSAADKRKSAKLTPVAVEKKAELTKRSALKQRASTVDAGDEIPIKRERVDSNRSDSLAKPISVRRQSITKQLNAAVNSDLAFVVAEDREHVYSKQMLPKVPAEFTIEEILREFLKSKDANWGELSDSVPVDFENNMVPKTKDLEELLICLLNLFDITVQRFLLYPIEKELFEKIGQNSNKAEPDRKLHPKVRFSKRFGITYLIRLLSRLAKIFNADLWDQSTTSDFVAAVIELTPFLAKNIQRFYKFEEYYERPPSDYTKRFQSITM